MLQTKQHINRTFEQTSQQRNCAIEKGLLLTLRRSKPFMDVCMVKGSPHCLKRLYQSTRSGIEENIALLVEQAHARLLEQEQLEIGWDSE